MFRPADLMLPLFVLLGLLVIASYTDISKHKIYNGVTYPGIVAGILLNSWEHGWDGFTNSLLGFLVCGLIMLFCFLLFEMGGGDVKLVAMMGACLGLHHGIEAMLWTFVLGSLMAAVILIWQIGVLRILSKTLNHIYLVLRAKSWIPLTPEERGPLNRGLFLAPAGLLAVCFVARDQLFPSFELFVNISL